MVQKKVSATCVRVAMGFFGGVFLCTAVFVPCGFFQPIRYADNDVPLP